MDTPNSSTEGRKGKHLTYEEMYLIEIRLRDGWKANRIAKEELKRSPNTVRNVIRKGMTALYNGKVWRFKAKTAWAAYQKNRQNCCRHYDALEKRPFLKYVEKHFKEDGWSLDACAGRALEEGTFTREETLCTKTLYNYVTLGLIGVKGIDLPKKLSRKSNKTVCRKHKKVLGRSIEERPSEVEERKEFGHWETDLVIGSKTGEDKVLLTLMERKTRYLSVISIPDKTADSVLSVFGKIKEELGSRFSDVFKTITTDNGSEFARLSELETSTNTKVYFAHPYSSWEKGSVENHNGLIRRFLRKGQRIDHYSPEDVLGVELWANGLPRRILGYKTPDEALEAELDAIYSSEPTPPTLTGDCRSVA